MLTKATPLAYKFQGRNENTSHLRASTLSYQGPGPGAYDILTTIGVNTPKIALKGKSSPMRMSDVPGPGTYDPLASLAAIKDRQPTVKMVR